MNTSIQFPAPADKITSLFVRKICDLQPSFIKGVYLSGSLALKDFYPNKSDIDFLVVCEALPSGRMLFQLKEIHRAISKLHPKPDLSGSYITEQTMKVERPEETDVLSWHEGSFQYTRFTMAKISLAELKSYAITLFGQKAATLPVTVSETDLKKFLYQNINSYWRRWLKQHRSVLARRILLFAFPRLTEWSVLGVARQFYTLQTGAIVSKTEAGLYCLKHLPSKFHRIISQAIEIRGDDRSYPIVKTYAIRPSAERLQQTLECVDYIIETFNNTYRALQNDNA